MELRYRDTWIRVDLNAIAHNVKTLKSAVGDAQLMAVVKANAYGHGIVPVAETTLLCGADALAVAMPEEGETLRNAGVRAPVLVLGGVSDEGAAASVRLGLTQTVFDAPGVESLGRACRALGKTAGVHIKLDTGMGRIGARNKEEVKRVLAALARNPQVRLTGAFTHFSDADGQSADYTLWQMRRFDALCADLPSGVIRHASASAALLRFPKARYDMVRGGIALYGCPPVDTPLRLMPALSFYTRVAFVKDVEAGDYLSYGRTFQADHPMRVATLPVGYGDGYHRAAGGRADVLIGGMECPVLGRVCMDQMLCDVSAVPGVKAGDEAVLLGRQGEKQITADRLAEWAGTISYEVLLSPTARVPVEYIPYRQEEAERI